MYHFLSTLLIWQTNGIFPQSYCSWHRCTHLAKSPSLAHSWPCNAPRLTFRRLRGLWCVKICFRRWRKTSRSALYCGLSSLSVCLRMGRYHEELIYLCWKWENLAGNCHNYSRFCELCRDLHDPSWQIIWIYLLLSHHGTFALKTLPCQSTCKFKIGTSKPENKRSA